MSRARNLKPGFFQNDVLAECDPLARILFQGLWCEADRAGRLEDRPKKIKAACLPYDDCDVDALLNQLQAKGFIARYVVDGTRYIAVLQFRKHQNPHLKEAESTIPAPCESGASAGDSGASPADSLFPLPSSLNPLELPKHTEIPITSPGTDSAPADAVGSFEGHSPADQAAATAKGRVLVDAAITIRGAGCKDVQASNPFLVQALADGITVAELADAARATGKPIKYLCTMVRGQKAEAAAFAGPLPPPIASTRNPNGPSARKTPAEEKAQERDALAAMQRQHKELGYGN